MPSEPLVLIVEDSPVQQRLIMDAFKRVGYTTRFDVQNDASGAWAAVDAMVRSPRGERPAFAVIDIGLPGMSGINLVDRIRHEAGLADWPMVVLTASTDPEDHTEAFMANATAYFQKPSGGSYEAVVRQMLDRLGPRVGWDPDQHQAPKRVVGPAGPAAKRSVRSQS